MGSEKAQLKMLCATTFVNLGLKMKTEYKAALTNLRSNALSYWSPGQKDGADENFAMSRIHSGLSSIRAPEAFMISGDSKFFCIGSCFAREVEDAIEQVGLLPLTKTLFLDAIDSNGDLFQRNAGVQGRPTAFLNRYNLGSMADLLVDIVEDHPINDDLLYGISGGVFHDYKYTRFLKPLPIENCVNRRGIIKKTYRNAIEKSNVFIFTFGLCEAFLDQDVKRFLNIAPDPRSAQGHTVDFQLLSYEENIRLGRRIVTTVKKIQPDAKIILTVSPVPLDATFTTYDIVVANNIAKSTLILVAHQLAAEFSGVYYFPSYEMVVNSEQSMAWLWDKKHVSEKLVNHIMNNFVTNHVSS